MTRWEGESFPDRAAPFRVGREYIGNVSSRLRESTWWTSRLAPITLMPAAALAVHQLRYFLAFGRGGSSELAETGHSYLHSLAPWLVLALALGAGAFLGRLGRAWRSGDAGSRSRSRLGLFGLWLTATVALVLIYASQEFLEGLFAAGHPAGLQGIFGDGGWLSLPAAAAIGAVVALLVRGGRAVIALAARLRGDRPLTRRDGTRLPKPRPVFLIAAAPLAACSPSRAPPSWL